MKRDMELVRRVLLDTEEHGGGIGWFELGDIEGHSAEEVSYHVKLLSDAGFIEALDRSHQRALVWHPKRLTWEGHEFLDAIRNDTVWAKTKKLVADKGSSIPFEVLKEVVMKLAREYFLE